MVTSFLIILSFLSCFVVGFGVCHRIRQQSYYHHPDILFISAGFLALFVTVVASSLGGAGADMSSNSMLAIGVLLATLTAGGGFIGFLTDPAVSEL